MQKLPPPPTPNEGVAWAEGAIHVASGTKEHRAVVAAEAWQVAAAGTTCSLPLHCGLECFIISESSVLIPSNVVNGFRHTLTHTLTHLYRR